MLSSYCNARKWRIFGTYYGRVCGRRLNSDNRFQADQQIEPSPPVEHDASYFSGEIEGAGASRSAARSILRWTHAFLAPRFYVCILPSLPRSLPSFSFPPRLKRSNLRNNKDSVDLISVIYIQSEIQSGPFVIYVHTWHTKRTKYHVAREAQASFILLSHSIAIFDASYSPNHYGYWCNIRNHILNCLF